MNPLRSLECPRCGAALQSDAKPGAVITCEHCGSRFQVPETPSAPVQSTIHIISSGNVTVHGDVVGGHLIVNKPEEMTKSRESFFARARQWLHELIAR
jgi:DNA-directed RNA polymerase subunit RPC12/RpoP